MKTTKKVMAGILGTALLLSSTTGLAANRWVFKNFVTEGPMANAGVYEKLWYEVDGRGVPTGLEKVEGVASTVEWRHEFYEKDYPHAEIVGLYLDGEATGVIKDSGGVANWETKYEPEMWEVKYPYQIHERLKTYIPGIGWYANTLAHRGVTEDDLLKYIGKNEPVTATYEYFGFGPYRIISKNAIASAEYRPGDVQALYNKYYWYDKNVNSTTLNGDYIVDATNILQAAGVPVQDFPFEGDIAGLTDLEIAQAINVYKSEYLTGRDYVNGGNQKIDVATYFTKDGVDASMFDPNFIVVSGNDHPVQISWTNQMFESEYPYRQYQYLIVDGVVCDGRTIGKNTAGKDVWLPYVYRYTGGSVLGLPHYNDITLPQKPIDPYPAIINAESDALK